jgi:hypothetical protein
MSTSFTDFISVAKTQILSGSNYITSVDNIVITESQNIAGMVDTQFPRVEIAIEEAAGADYESQRDMNWNFKFWFVGYLKRLGTSYLEQDLIDIWDFGLETMSSVIGILDYKIANPTLLPNFIQFEGRPKLYADTELIPGISTFMGHVSALFIKGDTSK